MTKNKIEELLKGIESDNAKEREQAVKFVSKQINGESSKARKTTKLFLNKWTGKNQTGE